MSVFIQKREHSVGNSGFTLIEMVVYTAILGVIATLAINSTLLMGQAFTNLRVSRDLNSGATTVLERLTRDIRLSNSIDPTQSTLGTHPGRLTMNTKDSGGLPTTVEFYIQDNLIKIKEGGIAKGELMASSTSVTNFIVRELSGTFIKAVKVDLTLSATRGTITKTRKFYTTVVMRNAY